MSRRTRSWIPFLVVAICLAAWARKEETIDQLKARVDSARPEDQANLCVEIALRQLDAADQLYEDGRVDPAKLAVGDIVKYAEMARDASVKTGKGLKNTEISVRKMAAKLRDIKRSLNFEDQPVVDAATQRLEDVRTDLLVRMFGKGKK
jgi:hypothetical protein